MAIPHFSFKGISKSKEQNIIASASYMARRKMKDNLETNPNKKIKKSFSTTKDHRLTLMMLPNGAPIDYQDPEICWNDLNAVEKDRLAVRFLLPLPKELTEAQGIELAKEWAYQEFVSKGLVVQLSFHAEKDDNGNFHCHGLGSYRQLVSGEWADVKSHKAYVDDKGDPLEKWIRLNSKTASCNLIKTVALRPPKAGKNCSMTKTVNHCCMMTALQSLKI